MPVLSYKRTGRGRTRRAVFALIVLALAGLACSVGSLPGLGGGDGDCQEISLEDIDLENLNLDDLDLPPLPGE
jgi:hypothetical protein